MTRRFLFFVSCLILMPSLAFSGAGPTQRPATWYPLAAAAAEGPPSVLVEASRPDRLLARISVPGLLVGTTPTKAGPRSLIEIVDGALTAQTGLPRLPVLRYLVEVPPASSVAVRAEADSVRIVPLSALGLGVHGVL